MFSSPDCLIIRREPHRKYKTSGHQMQIKLKIDNFSLYPLDIKRTGVYICTVVILFFVRLQNPLGQRRWGVF